MVKGDVDMPTDKPRFSVVLEPETSKELDAYWHEYRFKSKNAAINDLLRSAFKSLEQETDRPILPGISPDALEIARQYDKLSKNAQKLISAIVLFESADIETKNKIIAMLVDHANDKLSESSSFEGSFAEPFAAMPKIIEDLESATDEAEAK